MIEPIAAAPSAAASEWAGFGETLDGPTELPPPPRPMPPDVERLAGQLLGPADEPPAEDFPAVPGFDLVALLGRGGMGVVYLARQRRLNRLVALKMMRTAAGPTGADRFRTEVEAIARLQNPNIVQIFEVGEHDARPYCALEFVEGGTLARTSRDAPWAAESAAALIETLAAAVHYAHDRGVLHRDLKPANILLTATRQPKIADFGLAKWLDGGGQAGPTHSGVIVGTPSYMAPEQVAGGAQPVGVGADVYALGAILYELVTGRPPFKADTPLETVRQTLADDPVAPRRLQPRLPRDLETICLRCLAKEPVQRYLTAAALAEDLGRFRAGQPVLARPAGPAERTRKWTRRHPGTAAGIAAAALSLMVLSAAGWAMLLHTREYARQLATERDQANSARQEKELYLQQAIETAERLGSVANLVPLYPIQRDTLNEVYESFRQLYERETPTSDLAIRRIRAANLFRLAEVTSLLGRHDEAAKLHREAVARYRTLANQIDDGPLTYDFGRALGRLGNSLRLIGQHDDADRVLHEAIALQRRQIQLDPSQRVYRLALGRSVEFHTQLIHDRDDIPRLPEVRALLTEAIGHLEHANRVQRTGRSRAILATLHLLMGETLIRQSNHAAAATHARRVASLRLENCKMNADAARLLHRCAKLVEDDTATPAEVAEQYKRDAQQLLTEAKRHSERTAAPEAVD